MGVNSVTVTSLPVDAGQAGAPRVPAGRSWRRHPPQTPRRSRLCHHAYEYVRTETRLRRVDSAAKRRGCTDRPAMPDKPQPSGTTEPIAGGVSPAMGSVQVLEVGTDSPIGRGTDIIKGRRPEAASIHAPPRGATCRCPRPSRGVWFQSTHPRGVRPLVVDIRAIVDPFQSTYPRGVRPTPS